MKLGTEDKKKLQLLGVVGAGALVAVYFLYGELFGGTSSPPPAPAVVLTRTAAPNVPIARPAESQPGFAMRGTAAKVGSGGTALDPTLHMEAMERTESLVYSGSGRNIFASPGSAAAAPALVRAKFPARPKGPIVPVAPVYSGPPPPPPINLKFFGTVSSANGGVKALLLSGDNVFLAVPGDVVDRRYRVVSIAANSISIEDLPNQNTQTLPLLATP